MMWLEDASCRGTWETPTRQTCSRCPVRFQCLYLGFREPVGRYGGFDVTERRVFLRDARGDTDEALIAAWRSIQKVAS